jgi:hypothetical protein
MFEQVMLVPAGPAPLTTLIVAYVLAVSAVSPEAMAVFMLPSFHVLVVITCPLAIFSEAAVGASPFLNPRPTVNGNVPANGVMS